MILSPYQEAIALLINLRAEVFTDVLGERQGSAEAWTTLNNAVKHVHRAHEEEWTV